MLEIAGLRKRMERLRHVRFVVSILAAAILIIGHSASARAQETGSLHGLVLDPSGAVIPGAVVTLTGTKGSGRARSGADGEYVMRSLPAGNYAVAVLAKGFALADNITVTIANGQSRQLNLALSIVVEQENVQVSDRSSGVSLNADENSGAMILKGDDLNALSDDPDQLQSELQALAGPSAGPDGGQIYIDGFTGGQLPPKSSIREIRVNQNPFSAEFDRIGYGRIEILTKPGSDKFGGHITSLASDSALNTNSALVPNNPSYYLYFLQGDVNGPLTKNSSYFMSFFNLRRETQTQIVATDPLNVSAQLREAFPNPSSLLSFTPRFDAQLGKNNTLSVRDAFTRSATSTIGVGGLSLPSQASNSLNYENALQLSDTIVVNAHLINETRFQWRKVRTAQYAVDTSPTITVQGSFVAGGSSSGTVNDHQDLFELQNASTTTAGKHTIRFGTRLRAYRDANESNSGSNGNRIYQSVAQYQAGTPEQSVTTTIRNPLARALLFDAALFYQDDWHWKPSLNLSYGLRYEGQNRIHDHADLAPRFSLAWAPGYSSKTPPKTVIRAGYGWFYSRFTVPNSFRSNAGTPYVIQTIHQNGINQQTSVVNFGAGSGTTTPSIATIAPHFHAALSMQGGVGVDRQIGKKTTTNITYLFTRGTHQYLTNVVTAPTFDPAQYAVTGPTPDVFNNQFQSGGLFNEHQIISTLNARFKKVSVTGSYTYTEAKSDTSGVTYVPSVAQNPGLDYGRASFGIHHRVFLLGTYNASHGIILAPLLSAQSGTPYNFTTGADGTGNNQFNARPAYGTCGAPGVVSTRFGCLDPNPAGKGEKIVPYNLGTGPANVVVHMRISKVFGIGPHIKQENGGQDMQGGGSVSGRGLSGSQGQVKIDATVPRKYSLTFIAGAINIFNIANRGTPNGVLRSPLFGQYQTLADGPFGGPAPGNRNIFMQALFSF